jgi:hypothetical protein
MTVNVRWIVFVQQIYLNIKNLLSLLYESSHWWYLEMITYHVFSLFMRMMFFEKLTVAQLVRNCLSFVKLSSHQLMSAHSKQARVVTTIPILCTCTHQTTFSLHTKIQQWCNLTDHMGGLEAVWERILRNKLFYKWVLLFWFIRRGL